MNGEGYPNLKQVTKENVKAVLSDNTILISTAFAAVIQTLQNDPEMIKALYNISIADDDKDHKNNKNNIGKYFKASKHTLLDLAEKNYENLVKALTNNVMNVVVTSSSNPTLSSPQSSPTFSSPSNQSDTME